MTPDQFALPTHLNGLRELVDRCPAAEDRKALIVAAGASEAITAEEASLLITAYQLETA